MVTVTTVDPSTASSPKASGQPCSSYNYTWTTGGPSSFPNADHFYASDACAAGASLKAGSSFQVTRQDATSGTCTPSIRTIDNAAISACNTACM